MSLRNFFATSAARFAKSESGSIAVPFGLALVPLIAGLACAVDLSQAMKAKQRIQDVADIASLAAAQSLENNPTVLTKIAEDVFSEHFGATASAQVTRVIKIGDAVTVEARDNIKTTFAPIIGIRQVDVDTTSTSLFATRDVDIALVLDTTESMSGSKMAALKVAAGELVSTIDSLGADTVRLSVTPFAEHVNVGLSRRNEPWLAVPADRDRVTYGRVEGSERNCRRVTGVRDRDGLPEAYDYNTCDYDWEPNGTATDTWEGCVGSRNEPRDEQAPYQGVEIPGVLGDVCGSEIQPLTPNMATVSRSIQNMRAEGNTYMPAGLLWGWRSLEPSAPLVNPNPAPEGDQILVMMTDGKNSRSRTTDPSKEFGSHSERDKRAADDKTEALCDAIKGGKVVVYTIAFQVTDTPTRRLVSDCATDSSKYFDARDSQQLSEAFRAIGNSIKELRVSS